MALSKDDAGTHNLFAVLVEGCLDKDRTQSKAQSVIGVPNTSLPAGSAGLQQTNTSYNQLEPGAFSGGRTR